MRKNISVNKLYIFLLIAFFCCWNDLGFSTESLSSAVSVTVVYPKSENQYNNAKMGIRHLASLGANRKFESCAGDDVCGSEIVIDNPSYKTAICNQNAENYKLCAQREECTALNIECIQNEINIRSAEISNGDTTKLLEIRKNCNQVLLPACNRKQGISITPSSATLTNPNPNNTPIDPNAYGWFNEMCVVNGLERKIRNIIAHTTDSGVRGKCFIRPDSRDFGKPNCASGGKPPYCLCVEAPKGYVPGAGEVVRPETPREAGLCIDIPIPQKCPGITAGHADFPPTMIGLPDTYGICNQYWTMNTTPTGIAMKPTLSCLNVAGNPKWESTVRNPCVRYSCPSILTAGPGITGVYQGGYGFGETGENIGRSNGYAVWPKFTKTNDLLQPVNATACIWGFKKLNSTATYDSAGKINGYINGIAPVRDCDQLGMWQTADPTKICQRIQCPPVSPPIPTSATDNDAWNAWYASGGAEFAAINASRSPLRIQNESIATGVCNNRLGFFQSPGGIAPTRECDYLGNWSDVRNPCVTNCSEILNDTEASSLNNGFAKWNAINGVMSVAGIEGQFVGCATNYVTNPYPPAVDIDGMALPAATANDLTRPAENPRRLCKPGISSSGVASSVWATVVNGCINKCPGADADSRVGVGSTIHAKSNGNILINWSSTRLGEWDYKTNWIGSVTDFNASYFNSAERTNGYYLLRRKCNSNGKWSDPEVMCSLNDGQINNAKYFVRDKLPGLENSIPVGTYSSASDSQCVSGYWAKHINNNYTSAQPPQRKCTYGLNQFIDKTYLDLSSSPSPLDCELVTCPTYNYLGPRSKFNVTQRKNVNTQIQGTCLNDELNSTPPVINGVIPAGRTQVKTNTAWSTVPPTISCQADGTWSNIQDDCMKTCSVYNSVAAPSAPGNRYILKHNYYLRTSETWSDYDDDDDQECKWVTNGYSCNDGVLQSNGYGGGWGNENCCCDHYAKKYTPSGNSFCPAYVVGNNLKEVVSGEITPGMTCK